MPPARALFVGAGPMQTAWKALAAAPDLQDRIQFTGNVPDSDLPAYYQAASVFVLPSILPAETWGAVQIEAMASGLPSICTSLGTGTTYVNQDGVTGLVVPPRNPHALASAINRLLNDEPLRHRLGAAASCRAQSEFSHTHMLDQTLALYQRLLGN
jgi:rhamnosyl/mannosyltransferase